MYVKEALQSKSIDALLRKNVLVGGGERKKKRKERERRGDRGEITAREGIREKSRRKWKREMGIERERGRGGHKP